MKSLRRRDWIVYYSPRTEMNDGDPVQAFTTIGRVISDQPYRVQQTQGFNPFRVDVDYVTHAARAPIEALLETLELTQGLGSKWGMAVRRSKTKLSVSDMKTIAKAMGVDPARIDAHV